MKPRIQPYISRETHHRLQAMAKRPGLSESAIVERALVAYFADEADNQREAAINRRLDRLTRQFGRIERDNLVLAETLATFVHYFLTVTPPVPANQVEAARAKGDLRFDLFVRQVAEALRSGQRILQNAVEDVTADATSFESDTEHMVGSGPMRDAASHGRTRAMLVTALGDEIVAALGDPAVVEIMINPDGRLWVERHGSGRIETGLMPAADTERVIRLVASHMGRRADAASPIVSAELPIGGERFEGVLPPVSSGPCFSIRRPAGRVIALSDYVTSGVMAAHHAEALRRAVLERENILVVGGTGSGKTTLANALLAEIARTGDRLVILEDTRELVSAAEDTVQLRTQPGSVSLADLVRSTLRLRPDRIIIGEVRGAEALDMLKAWNTGHPGGIATLHANSALGGLSRLEQLIGEASAQVPHDLIAETIDCVVYISRRAGRHRVETVARMNGLGRGGYDLSPVQPELQLVLPSLPFSEPLLSTAPERTPPQ